MLISQHYKAKIRRFIYFKKCVVKLDAYGHISRTSAVGRLSRLPHCQTDKVYKMVGRNGERNKDVRRRCRDCRKMYTVRTGTVSGETRLPLKVWVYAIWKACSRLAQTLGLQCLRSPEGTGLGAPQGVHCGAMARRRLPYIPGELQFIISSLSLRGTADTTRRASAPAAESGLRHIVLAKPKRNGIEPDYGRCAVRPREKVHSGDLYVVERITTARR